MSPAKKDEFESELNALIVLHTRHLFLGADAHRSRFEHDLATKAEDTYREALDKFVEKWTSDESPRYK